MPFNTFGALVVPYGHVMVPYKKTRQLMPSCAWLVECYLGVLLKILRCEKL